MGVGVRVHGGKAAAGTASYVRTGGVIEDPWPLLLQEATWCLLTPSALQQQQHGITWELGRNVGP